MLETGDALATWCLPETPDTAAELIAESLPHHRPLYLDYEGAVSGGRGTVTSWDRGTYEFRRQTETEWLVAVAGQRLRGLAKLTRVPESQTRWRFSFDAGDVKC
jgi:hypothetical protein